jgi:hypothetical protein
MQCGILPRGIHKATADKREWNGKLAVAWISLLGDPRQ